MNISKELIKNYKKDNKKFVFLPSGLTPVLQPLDITVNKLFKDGFRNLYIQYMIVNWNAKHLKVKRKDLI